MRGFGVYMKLLIYPSCFGKQNATWTRIRIHDLRYEQNLTLPLDQKYMPLKCFQILHDISNYQVQYCTHIECSLSSSVYSVCLWCVHNTWLFVFFAFTGLFLGFVVYQLLMYYIMRISNVSINYLLLYISNVHVLILSCWIMCWQYKMEDTA